MLGASGNKFEVGLEEQFQKVASGNKFEVGLFQKVAMIGSTHSQSWTGFVECTQNFIN